MKTIWKGLGITTLAAAAAALVPYKVKKDSETGSTSARALLWEGSHTPATGTRDRSIVVNVRPDLNTLKQKAGEIREKVTGDAPAVDDKAPAVNVDTPVVDAEAPAVTIEPPAFEIETPVVEAAPPAIDDMPETPIW